MILNNLHCFVSFFSARADALAKSVGQGRSALCNPRIMKQSFCHTTTIIHYLSVGISLTTRVVDPLSLATVADSIMISVCRPQSLWCRFIRFMVSVYSILCDSNLFDSRFRFIRFCASGALIFPIQQRQKT